MNVLLIAATLAAISIGLAHSILGERYILTRLFRRTDLPMLFGSDLFTRRTLRFAWHLTTVAWWGLAAIIYLLAQRSITFQNLAFVLASTFVSTGTITLLASRGRHFAWPVFLFIGGACWYAAITQSN